MAKKNLWKIDRQGNLQFDMRTDLANAAYRADSRWESKMAAVIVMLICGTLDFVMFSQLFGAILTDNALLRALSVIGCLVAFDLAPIYLGIQVRKLKQGLNASMLVIGLFIGAFVLVTVGNIWLRIEVKDLVMPNTTQVQSLFGSVSTKAESNPMALPYAIFAAFLPIATSVVSFGISYMTANPLKDKMKKLKEEQIQLEEGIDQLEAVLREYKDDADFQARLLEADRQQYAIMLQMNHEQGIGLCNYVRERIKEHLGDPASSNELSKDNRDKLYVLFDRMEERERELSNHDSVVA